MTQEFMALMLGVRRVGVTNAASSLQNRGLIHYNRGNIAVLDRRGLKAASCGCYKADRESYDRVLGASVPGCAHRRLVPAVRIAANAHAAPGAGASAR
jgi:hypothetical protein